MPRLDLCEDCDVVGPDRMESEMFERMLCRRCFGDRVIIMGIEHATCEARPS